MEETCFKAIQITVAWNKVLRKIFGPKKGRNMKVGSFGYKSELRHLYRPLDVVRKVGSRRLQWTGHQARTGETKKEYRILVGKLGGRVTLLS